MFKNLPEIYKGKVIPRNFGHIGHLTGSKMIDNHDILLSEKNQYQFTTSLRNKNDIVIITEKIDGMNAGVVKKNGLIYPINRKGYDVRQSMLINEELYLLMSEWAKYVDDNYMLFDSILEECEHMAFENAIIQHTLRYKFKTKPVFLLAKFDSKNKKINYNSLSELSNKYGFVMPPLLNIGIAVPPDLILKQYPVGKAGIDDKIMEGIVYSYEHEGEHESCAKFVANPIMGTINTSLKYYNKCIW